MSNQLSNGLLARRRRINPLDPSTLARISAAQSTTASITCPTVQAGDLLLFSNSASLLGGPTLVTPSGFTLIDNVLIGTTYRHSIFYKKAVGTEGGTNLAGMSADQQLISLAVFRKTPAIAGIALSSVNSASNFGTAQLADQTVAAAGGVSPLLIIGNFGVVTEAVSNSSMSPAEDSQYTAFGSFLYDRTKHKFYANAPADAVVSMDTTAYPSTNLRKSMRSFYFSFS